MAGRDILLIFKPSFDNFRNELEDTPVKKETVKSIGFKDFLQKIDQDYVSVTDVIKAIQNSSDSTFEEAAAILLAAIGHSDKPPKVYQKNSLKQWLNIYPRNHTGLSEKESNIKMAEHAIEDAIDREADDLPF